MGLLKTAQLAYVAGTEDVPSSSVKIGAVAAATFTRKSVFLAQRPCRLVGVSLVDDGASTAADAANYWEIQVRKLGFDPYGKVYKDMVMASGPLRYWPLDERSGTAAADYAGVASNGTHTSGPLVAQAGPPGADDEVSVAYDGVDDYTDLGNHSLGWGNMLSIEGWVRPATVVATRKTLFGTDNAAAQPQIEFGNTVAGRIQVVYPTVTAFTGPSTFPLRALDWNHILYTRSGVGATHRLYVNGVDLGSGTTAAGDYVDASAKRTIARRAAASQLFDGRIAHHALYNKALTQGDAEDRYGTIARKSTALNIGEAITQNRAWNFDTSRISPFNQYLRQREVVVVEFHPFGSPTALSDVTVSLRMEPV